MPASSAFAATPASTGSPCGRWPPIWSTAPSRCRRPSDDRPFKPPRSAGTAAAHAGTQGPAARLPPCSTTGFRRRKVLPRSCRALARLDVKPSGGRDARSPQDLHGAVFAPGSAWAVRIPELDREASAARLSQVEAVARALVSTYAADDTGAVDFTVELMPDALSAALAAAAAARAKAVRSPVQEIVTRRRLARQLYVEGLEVADIAAALGVSSRRVQLLLSERDTLPVPAEAARPSPPSSHPSPPATGTASRSPRRRGSRPSAPRRCRAETSPRLRSTATGTRPSFTAAKRVFSRARSRSCARALRPRPRRHGHRPGAPAHPGARGPRVSGQGRRFRRHAPSGRQPGPHHPGVAAASRRAG